MKFCIWEKNKNVKVRWQNCQCLRIKESLLRISYAIDVGESQFICGNYYGDMSARYNFYDLEHLEQLADRLDEIIGNRSDTE